MTTWDEIVKADGRIAAMAAAAERVVRFGEQHRDYPDAVYQQTKRYLAALVGDFRSHNQPVQPRRSHPGLAVDLATILRRPVPVLDETAEELLRKPPTYQLACTYIYDRLCKLYDWRWRYAG